MKFIKSFIIFSLVIFIGTNGCFASPTPEYLETKPQITKLAQQCSGQPYITVDTEFFTPEGQHKLRIIQVGHANPKTGAVEVSIINCFSNALKDPKTLRGFFDILQDGTITKVFHAPREDLKLLSQLMGGKKVTNCFDTQLAYACISDNATIGYGALVKQYEGVALDKSKQTSAWWKNKLSQEQLRYAANDVFYLHRIYPKLLAQLQSLKREAMYSEEFDRIYTRKPLMQLSISHEFNERMTLDSDLKSKLFITQSLVKLYSQSLSIAQSLLLTTDEIKAHLIKQQFSKSTSEWRKGLFNLLELVLSY